MTVDQNQNGFTLIELVISISILVMIVAIAYGSLGHIMETKGLLDDERDLGMIANAVLNRMTRELQLATDKEKLLSPKGDLDKKYAEDVDMLGESESLGSGNTGDRITFMASDGGQYVRDGLTHSGVVQITYRVEQDPEQRPSSSKDRTFMLIRDEVPFSRNYEKAYQKIMTFPITRDLVSLQFMYFDGDEWSRDWKEEQKSLPRMIKLIVKIKSHAGKVQTYSTIVPIGATEKS